MAKRKRMDQIRTILSNYLASGSVKATARQLKMSKNTVREYVRRARACEQDLAGLLALDDTALEQLLLPPPGSKTNRLQVLEENMDHYLSELRRVGVTRQLLWQEYRLAHPGGYGYTQFCEHLRRAVHRHDLTLPLEHRPGEVLMLDFAGKKMHWVDPHNGEVHDSEVLIGVLPYSQYSFCIALPSQSLPDLIHGINQCLLFLGVLPRIILSDNMRSYVSRPDRYEPTFTRLCEQLGAHYQLELQATRVAKPRDKASVENAVMQVYRRIYAPLRDETFHSLEDLNMGIGRQLIRHNEQAYQKRSGCRTSVFAEHERPAMRPLPPELFEIRKITRAKVQRNYHVYLGEEKNFYSVPYAYVGRQTEIIYTSRTVEVYADHQRIALHERLFAGGREYRYQTLPEHMPRHHREWKEAQGYDEAYFLGQATRIGPATHWVVQQLLISRIHQSQTYNSCKGILHLARQYSDQRLEAACERCRQAGKGTYGMVKRILRRGLEQAPSPPDQLSLGLHENIRGSENYQ